MTEDTLGLFVNWMGLVIVALVLGYHFVVADPKFAQEKSKEGEEGGEGALVLVDGAAGGAAVVQKETKEGFLLAPPPDTADRRTAAERRHDEKMAAREGEKTRKMALKSHRERVNEFNAALEQLSEHHDIPRVGPG
ncbi:hypothetical protein WJX81_008286 [Elliptochloris bilobata]|uniref:Dolichyl-diphosphooligosaccharide--protein glycosyltransferase subunit 4 n=1 Tax=Elliptochloris bilobata TaxID=381761 RepID=A0AAW1QM35_9CHLO